MDIPPVPLILCSCCCSFFLFVRECILFCCHYLAAGPLSRAVEDSPAQCAGGERKLQKGAHTIVLPAQCDCSSLGIVGKQLRPRKKLLGLYLRLEIFGRVRDQKWFLVLVAKQYSVRTIYTVFMQSREEFSST